MMNRLIIPKGYEIRVELVRLYPDQQDHRILKQLQREVMDCTNHIIRSRKDVISARKAYAIKHGIGGTPPALSTPPYLPKPTTPEEKSIVRQAWKEYNQLLKATRAEWSVWYKAVENILKDMPEMSWRDDDYKSLRKMYGNLSYAVLFRDTFKRVITTPHANYKRDLDHVPLVWRNSSVLKTGDFYGDRRGIPWYDALVKVNGMSIPGRLRRPLPGKPVQGFSIFKRPDGWYATVNCIVRKRELPGATLPPIGVDVGQTDLVALSDGYSKNNPRNASYVSALSRIQSIGDLSGDKNIQKDCWNQVGRLLQSARRRIHHWINSDLLPHLAKHSVIFIEKLAKGFKNDKGPVSCMHTILNAIKERFGPRAKSVECAYTSQKCSRCGHIDKSARQGKIYTCVRNECGMILDADTNASKNVLSLGLSLLT